MTYHAVTVNLPENIYKKIRRVADKDRRPFDEVLLDAISAATPTMDVPIQQFRSALAQMAYLNDAALWQAARATLTPAQRNQLEQLHHKQQRETLTDAEQKEIATLEELYRDTLLVRAQAAALLKQRNYNVSDPSQFSPLE